MSDSARPSAPAEAFTYIVRTEGLDMTFGMVRALQNVDFAVGRNEIVGLLGDNGAGKSTLIKVLSGVLRPTAGRIWVRDQLIDPRDYSVRMAHELKIETVHQEKSLGEKQPLWRNMFVGRQITDRFGFIKVNEEKAIADRMLRSAIGLRGTGISVDSTVRDLSGGERQGIAIGRAMYFEADLIVLDEPTVALAVSEVRKVLRFVENIKESGRAGIYIEHNLAHVYEVADRLVIMDRGEIVRDFKRGELSLTALTEFMISLHEEHGRGVAPSR